MLRKERPRHVVLDAPRAVTYGLWLDLLTFVGRSLGALQRGGHWYGSSVFFAQWDVAFVPIDPCAIV